MFFKPLAASTSLTLTGSQNEKVSYHLWQICRSSLVTPPNLVRSLFLLGVPGFEPDHDRSQYRTRHSG
jgi:hypothetical protein